MINNPPWNWTVDQAIEKYDKLKQSEINSLKEWMKGETHLPSIPDEQLVLFHHACKYELDKTKETIEKCYEMRTKYKELFANRDPSHPFIQEIMKVVICTPLRGFDAEGNQVIWIRLNNLNPDRYYFGTSLKAIFMTMDAIQVEVGPVPGYVYVIDGKGYTLSHMLRATITLCKRFIQYSQEGSTFFPKAIHVLNLSSVLEKVVAIVKPFMKSDLFSVITFYKPGKQAELFQHLPASIIPNEYGGKGGVLTEIQEEHAQQLVKYKDWFAKEELLRIDEAKRPNGRSCAESVCKEEEEELNTSLKRLEID